MGTAAYGGKGFKEETNRSGERPMGAAGSRQQSTQASCHSPTPLPHRAQAQPQAAPLPLQKKG